jgi:hypothetical protein
MQNFYLLLQLHPSPGDRDFYNPKSVPYQKADI